MKNTEKQNFIDLYSPWSCNHTKNGVQFLISRYATNQDWLKDFKTDLNKKPTEKEIEKGMIFLMKRLGQIEKIIDCEGWIYRKQLDRGNTNY
tara:strand:+ start:23 stop:298 length:276 start_codon:yes stop_codon:yes gene_type:complete